MPRKRKAKLVRGLTQRRLRRQSADAVIREFLDGLVREARLYRVRVREVLDDDGRPEFFLLSPARGYEVTYKGLAVYVDAKHPSVLVGGIPVDQGILDVHPFGALESRYDILKGGLAECFIMQNNEGRRKARASCRTKGASRTVELAEMILAATGGGGPGSRKK